MNKKKCREGHGVNTICDALGESGLLTTTKAIGLVFCPFCGVELEPKPEVKVGMFGKFWDVDYKDAFYDVLTGIDLNEKYPYGNSGDDWKNFEPGLPEGFNQDGTPK